MLQVHEYPDSFSSTQKSFTYFYPTTSGQFDLLASKNLFSNFKLEFPITLLQRVQDFVSQFYTLTQNPDYQKKVLHAELAAMTGHNHKASVLCCFDFHYNSKSESLKLIEVNTNASGYLVGGLAIEGFDISSIPYRDELLRSFKHSDLLSKNHLYIMDAKPTEQKMYLEFLLYQEFLQKHTQEVSIVDSQVLEDQIARQEVEPQNIAIYNRDTDFYLDHLPQMQELYKHNILTLSPHPWDYDLMAKKTNLGLLQEWEGTDESFHSYFLRSGLVREHFKNYEDLVKEKKALYFKPPSAFGGKSIYKGASVSNKYLQSVWDENFLFQQSFPAEKFKDSQQHEWKYDLRFFTYEGLVQFYIARVYQGQITNFQTQGGGFAPVVFT